LPTASFGDNLLVMRQSELFTRIERNAPKDETTTNAQLLARAGFASKLMSGVYSYLPLGLRVLRNIEKIVREEMDAIGGQELLMPVLHPKSIWTTTGGWDKIDILFKLKSRTDKEYALGQSEEEVVTPLVMKYVKTYKDLPRAIYQIHWKFRDELRSKSGLLRGVEFFMKDMYSFHENQEDFDRFYAVAKGAYMKIFKRLGLTAKVTEASGGTFSEKISYEFEVLTDAGEDNILYCDACDFCVNVEIAKQKEGSKCPRCGKGKLVKARASEVGNVFDLGQKYGKDFDMGFAGRDGKKQYPVMGCYGIGISRLMGVIVEKYNDKNGIIWPTAVAPFKAHLLALAGADGATAYEALQNAGIEVLYDDRDASAGEKFAEADLIGIPWRVVVSPKTGAKVEVKKRNETESKTVDIKEAIAMIKVK
jgi:prolyl-tRNA synthetase